MKKILIEYCIQNVPCLVLDLNGAFKLDAITAPCQIDNVFECLTQHINVETHGVPCGFLAGCLTQTDNDHIQSDNDQLVRHS